MVGLLLALLLLAAPGPTLVPAATEGDASALAPAGAAFAILAGAALPLILLLVLTRKALSAPRR